MSIPARYFIHSEDHAAMEKLKSIPMFSSCVKMFMKLITEQQMHGLNMANKIRLGPQQLPEIYQHLPPIREYLGIEEPEFYLEMNPIPNAYTYGDTKTFLTVTSGLVECLEDDELQAVIAHECGHIACRHVLYHTIAEMILKGGAAAYKALAIASMPIRLALLYWYRRSELSADRAAAVVMKNAKPVVETMIRLAGGPKSITEKVNLDLYIQQADAYDKLTDSTWDKILQGVAIMQTDHPFLSVRTREIRHWCQSDQFKKILQVIDEEKTTSMCPGCNKPTKESWKFCAFCGYQNTHKTTN
ncbi:MAG: peptidase M48 [Candidatus Brocadia sp. UTAMX2]|jgi:Zn-dependent protease with chaperone function|nr:MAG: peptidase M48 [Candidatus Brocadia sp. UTAMX2]